MKERLSLEAGRVAVSRAGRDRGTAYVLLTDPAEGRVLVADGCGRTADHPKRKNVKHLMAKPRMLPGVSEKFSEKKRSLDQEVRNILDADRFPEA